MAKDNAIDWVKYAWLGLGDINQISRSNPLIKRTEKDVEQPGWSQIKLMRNPDYVAFTSKMLLDIQLLPEQSIILSELWTHPFPMYVASRGFGKSFLLALYATLKCILYDETKVVIIGSGFRQAKVIFEYMESIWRKAPILRDLCDGNSGPRRDVDRCTMKINNSWACAVPLGDGSKIRGLRANVIIADEFGSIPLDIYETVIVGFAAVSADPVTNVQEAARRKALSRLGIWTAEAEQKYSMRQHNQAIISGTADYAFKPFAKYWKRYHDIISSRGDPNKLREVFGIDDIPSCFNYKDYSIVRIPYELIPEGFMDDKQILRAKATIHSGVFAVEYGATFPDDSTGFFKRSLIDSCVGTPESPIRLPSEDIWFDVTLRGNNGCEYVLGVDPASESDNFSIVVLELRKDHSRIVYGWSTNKKDFKTRLKRGLADKEDFYGFCARKIRDLMKAFNIIAIALDGQGGGIAIEEALHDPDKMEEGELPIWQIRDDDKPKDSDDKPGLHILHVCQFARAEWTSAANHGLRKDLEDKVLIFPRFDPVTLGLAAETDNMRQKAFEQEYGDKIFDIYDTLEDAVMEIEELKTELSTIVMTQTSTGNRDRWDTPEIKLNTGRKGKLRKDRYSALVMANMVARQYKRVELPPKYNMIGDFAHNLAIENIDPSENYYQGPEWFVGGMKEMLDFYK